ncbi:MAG: ABC transporter substrate-binding protein [Solirubrobacteraceae bacterium]
MESQRQQDSIERLGRRVREGGMTRAEVLRRAAAAGFAFSLPAVLAACGSETGGRTEGSPASRASDIPSEPGGMMRIALPAGVAGALDPHAPASLHARLRNSNVFDTLFMVDNAGKLVPALADEASSNADATEWTIRIKPGIEFHDGSPLTIEDILYSLRRILDPKTSAEGMGQISMIDRSRIKKLDDRTVRIGLQYPFSILPDQLASGHVITIVKDGENRFDPPIGTGAFKFERGNDSDYTLARNASYWQPDLPRLDTVEVIAIQDATARLNALKTGEVDANYPVDFTEAASVRSDPNITTFVNKTGTFMPMYMRADTKPFSDNRVREALKFAADRETMNQLAYGGEGIIGNDLFVPSGDPAYPAGAEQRPFDPERARALWSEAGMAGTRLQFWTSAVWPGQLTAATAYAQKAKDAGIDIEIKKLPDDQFISKIYGIKPFANDYWKYTPILTIMSLAFVPGADYFKTASWATDETTRLYEEAASQTDEAKRNELSAEIMLRFRDEGPYIVWAFEASPDLYSAKIGGQENSVVRSLNGFRLEKFFIKA